MLLKNHIFAAISIIIFTSTSSAQQTIKLEDFLNQAVAQSEQFKSIQLSVEALKAEIKSRDLGLTSELVLEATNTIDKKDSFTNNLNRRSDSKLYSLGLEKEFSTGTLAQISMEHEDAEQNTFTTSPLYRSDWEISISQQLWGNAFGRGTRLRQSSQQAELRSREYELILRKQQLLASFEEKYWDLAYFYKQLEVQKANLKRSVQILDWTRKRYNMSAARDTDLLQAQALLATRQLDMTDLENQIEKIWVQLKTILPEVETKSWQPDLAALPVERSVEGLLYNSGKATTAPSKLESLSAQYRLQQFGAQSKTTQDDITPSLELILAHGRNGVREDAQDSIKRAQENDTTYNQIGLALTVDLDIGLNRQRQDSLRLQAKAAEFDAKRLERQNKLDWEDLNRQLVSLREQLRLATELSKFQKSKSEQERKFYQQGRSTIFQAISFEVEAADAELRVYRLLNSIRKTESQARLFGHDRGEG